jgi:hypothetical protein
MKEFITQLLGGITIIQFMVFLALGVAGLTLNIIWDISRRKPCSPSSPQKFFISYWFKDNWKRLIISFVFLPLVVLLFNEITGGELNRLNAFYAGFSADALAELIKRRSFIGSDAIK